MIYALRTAKMFLVHLKHFYEIVACKLESLFPLMPFDFFFLERAGGGVYGEVQYIVACFYNSEYIRSTGNLKR